MIITHKEFPNYRKFEMDYEGRKLSMEVGKLAELCNAAVLVTYGRHRLLPPRRGLQREALRRRPHPRQLHAP